MIYISLPNTNISYACIGDVKVIVCVCITPFVIESRIGVKPIFIADRRVALVVGCIRLGLMSLLPDYMPTGDTNNFVVLLLFFRGLL